MSILSIRTCAVLWLVVALGCSSQKSQPHTDNSHPDSGSSTGGTSDAGTQPDADTAASGGSANSTGGQSNSSAGASNNAAGASSVGGASAAGASNNAGGSSSVAGASSATGGTEAGGAGGATGGVKAATGGTASPGLPSLCSPKAKPAQSQAVVGITLDSAARFAAITPDELTLVWTVSSTTGVTVFTADRANTSASWNLPQSVTDVPAADGAVTITPDGLTIAFVNGSSHLSIETLSRPDRASSFTLTDPTSNTDFTALNSSATLATGETYAYPLYGPHLTSFYYAVKSASGDLTWYVSGRFEPQGSFSSGSVLSFTSAPAPANVLSGVAFDENTLFFVDTASGQSSWTFYDEISLKFASPQTLGNFGYVQPSQTCTRLYSELPAGGISTEALQ